MAKPQHQKAVDPQYCAVMDRGPDGEKKSQRKVPADRRRFGKVVAMTDKKLAGMKLVVIGLLWNSSWSDVSALFLTITWSYPILQRKRSGADLTYWFHAYLLRQGHEFQSNFFIQKGSKAVGPNNELSQKVKKVTKNSESEWFRPKKMVGYLRDTSRILRRDQWKASNWMPRTAKNN